MVTTAATPAPRALPESQQQRILAIRAQMYQDAQAAVRRYSGPLRERADVLMDKVWKARNNPRRVRALCKGFWANGVQPLADAVSDVVMDAVLYAERYEEMLVSYKVARRHGLKDVPGPKDVKAVGDYETYFHLNYGEPGARAAMAYAYRQARTRQKKRGIMAEYERSRKQGSKTGTRAARKRLRAFERYGTAPSKTRGDQLIRKHRRPWQGVDGLSRHLHGTAATEGQEMSRVVLRSIRESERASSAARELQRLVKLEGHAVGAGSKRPKLIDDLLEAGEALQHNAQDPEVWAQWEKAQRRIKRYTTTLAPRGTVQTAYLEVLQDVQSDSFRAKDIRKAVDKWSYQKQRYQAERIIKTEQATAHRIEQMEKQKGQSWIVGYRWQMAAQLHATKMRKRGGRKKLGGKRCICEVMDQTVMSPEVAREYPQGGHPHCLCTFVPVYSEKGMMEAPITSDEDAWYNANFGQAA